VASGGPFFDPGGPGWAALGMTAKKNRHPPPLERFFAALRMTTEMGRGGVLLARVEA
jgi:hypothetical protein